VQGIVDTRFFKERLAAISVGRVDNTNRLDLSFEEDSAATADFNFVMTQSEKLVEVQGTAEKEALAWEHFDEMKNLAHNGIKQLFVLCQEKLEALPVYQDLLAQYNAAMSKRQYVEDGSKKDRKPGLFSIANRVSKP
jgi:hypothetical protein